MDRKRGGWKWTSTSTLAASFTRLKSASGSHDVAGVQQLVSSLHLMLPATASSQDPVLVCLSALRQLEEDLLNVLREAGESVLDALEAMQTGQVDTLLLVKLVGRRMKEFLRVTSYRSHIFIDLEIIIVFYWYMQYTHIIHALLIT